MTLNDLGLKRITLLSLAAVFTLLAAFGLSVWLANQKLEQVQQISTDMGKQRQQLDAEQSRYTRDSSALLVEYAQLGDAYRKGLNDLKEQGFELLNLVIRLANLERETGDWLLKTVKQTEPSATVQSKLQAEEPKLRSNALDEQAYIKARSTLKSQLMIDEIMAELAKKEAAAQQFVDKLDAAVGFDADAKKQLARLAKKMKGSRKAITKGYMKYDATDHRLSTRVERYQLLQTDRITLLMGLTAGPAQKNADQILAATGKLTDRTRALNGQADELERHARQLQESAAQTSAAADAALQSQADTLSSIRWQIGLFLLVLLAFSIVAALGFRSVVVQRVLNLSRAMHGISEGGDLSHRLPQDGSDELGQVAHDFNRFIENITDIVGQIDGVTRELEQANNRINAVSQGNSDSAQQLNSGVSAISAALGDLRDSVAAVAGEAQQTQQGAQEAAQMTRSGSDNADRFVGAARTVAERANSAAQRVANVASQSAAIEQVLSVIQEISDQTNMLALNAAIEAARAGDQGRGFAVVADEVRGLAGKTQQATQDIHSHLEALANDVKAAESEMQHMAGEAEQSGQAAEQVKASFDAIVGEVEQIANLNRSIADATEGQHHRVVDIDSSLQGVTAAAENTLEGVEASRDISHTLGRLLSSLEQAISKFKR